MRPLNDWDRKRTLAHNLRDNGTAVAIFADTQTERVQKARTIVAKLLDGLHSPATIVEPGCSAGDISGYFAREGHNVIGIDVVPEAVRLARERYPQMTVYEMEAENFPPIRSDILILCEFLEHIPDPLGFISMWLGSARYAVIGHPLVGDGIDPEPGHLWAYDSGDFLNWWAPTHRLISHETFPMGPYNMVLGWGERR